MSPAFRLLLHPRMEGRLDMAIDEALAEAVGAGESPPVVRLYGFSPPTLSLGRFQKVKDHGTSALLPSREIVKKWWKYMADLMECNPDNSPVVVPLKEVFHMD